MIGAPRVADPPLAVGPLPSPPEEELAAAYPELRGRALALNWAAVSLGLDAARVKALARTGGLLVVPGPWPLRKAYATGAGYLVPAWQLAAGARSVRPELPLLLDAAAGRGWTSLELDRFMTTRAGGRTPAELLRAGEGDRVLALIRGETPPAAEPPARRRRLSALLHRHAPA